MNWSTIFSFAMSIMAASFGLVYTLYGKIELSTYCYSAATYLICLGIFNHLTDRKEEK